MLFEELRLKGAFLVSLDKREDDRGFFGRAWCEKEFQAHGLTTRMVQSNVSVSKHRGTLRGLHFQRSPFAEAKLIRAVRGAIYDVIVDLRTDSPTFGEWCGFHLDALSYRMLYVPELFAHGFLTLRDDTEVFYQVSGFYTPEAEGGVRFDDPTLGIDWPIPITAISLKDSSLPDLDVATGGHYAEPSLARPHSDHLRRRTS
ncbi:MAG: dTDP-4-dehydrorhamnose 3,5-epimerase [Acidobacteria bacterium]|nr:MAG: dTDP-4-dehydrorhamnose 3,5-epimerase [Acidobacteriota bacterium]